FTIGTLSDGVTGFIQVSDLCFSCNPFYPPGLPFGPLFTITSGEQFGPLTESNIPSFAVVIAGPVSNVMFVPASSLLIDFQPLVTPDNFSRVDQVLAIGFGPASVPGP